MQQHQIEQALARAGWYRWLSMAFAYPEPDGLAELERVQGLLAQQGVWEGPPEWQAPAASELTVEYLRLFDQKAACTPYESEYGDGAKAFTKSRELADIAGFYQAFGFDLNPGANDLYDHIKVQLAFMGLLALKEAYALSEGHDEGLAVTVDAQKSFLEDHLGRWAIAFCEGLEHEAVLPFYRELAQKTQATLLGELKRCGVEPRPLYRLPQSENQDSCLSCPMAT